MAVHVRMKRAFSMSQAHQVQLAQSRFGRVVLHIVATLKAGHVRFHLAGILRELH